MLASVVFGQQPATEQSVAPFRISVVTFSAIELVEGGDVRVERKISYRSSVYGSRAPFTVEHPTLLRLERFPPFTAWKQGGTLVFLERTDGRDRLVFNISWLEGNFWVQERDVRYIL